MMMSARVIRGIGGILGAALARQLTIRRNGRTSMNAMQSNLSHDLDVSLAYLIDKKVGGQNRN
jgi:hypothetical protein